MGWAKYYEDNLELALSREPLIFEQDVERSVTKAKPVCKELADTPLTTIDASQSLTFISTKTEVEAEYSTTKKQYKAKELCCQECGRLFLFSSKVQELFDGNGWKPPKRCKTCRETRNLHYLMRAS